MLEIDTFTNFCGCGLYKLYHSVRYVLEFYINVLWVIQTVACWFLQLRFLYLDNPDFKLPNCPYSFQVNNLLCIYLDLNLFSKVNITSDLSSISECSGCRMKLVCNSIAFHHSTSTNSQLWTFNLQYSLLILKPLFYGKKCLYYLQANY